MVSRSVSPLFYNSISLSNLVQKSEIRKPLATGLINIGNTCFLNAVMQSLASTRAFQFFVHSQCTEKNSSNTLTMKLKKTLSDLSNGSKVVTRPEVERSEELRKRFLTREQQDAHELMQFVMEVVSEESEKNFLGFAAATIEKEKSAFYFSRFLTVPIKAGPKNQTNPFIGLLKSTLQCERCGHASVPSYSKFTDISLALPPSLKLCSSISLEDCLKYFTEVEHVTDVICSRCSHGSEERPVKGPAKKRLSIARAPQTLCLHIRRMVGPYQKMNNHIAFPFELDISPYCSVTLENEFCENPQSELKLSNSSTSSIKLNGGALPFTKPFARGLYESDSEQKLNSISSEVPSDPSLIYSLKSVIVHHGNHYGGHYTVYLRPLQIEQYQNFLKHNNPEYLENGENWVHISDENVQVAFKEEVRNSQAYMLYYEKVNSI